MAGEDPRVDQLGCLLGGPGFGDVIIRWPQLAIPKGFDDLRRQASLMQITVTADILAWYAAIVSTIALAVRGLSAWRDRARVSVSARFGYRMDDSPSPYKRDTNYIVITVANSGRRPSTIARVGFSCRKAGKELVHVIASDSLWKGSQELTEGRSAMYLVEQGDLKPDDLVKVWAYDHVGKEHRGRVDR